MAFSRDFMELSMSSDGTTLIVDGKSSPNGDVAEILVFVQFDGKLHQSPVDNLATNADEWHATFPVEGFLAPEIGAFKVVGIATFHGKDPESPKLPEVWDRIFGPKNPIGTKPQFPE
jgi:hypothetical protein